VWDVCLPPSHSISTSGPVTSVNFIHFPFPLLTPMILITSESRHPQCLEKNLVKNDATCENVVPFLWLHVLSGNMTLYNKYTHVCVHVEESRERVSRLVNVFIHENIRTAFSCPNLASSLLESSLQPTSTASLSRVFFE